MYVTERARSYRVLRLAVRSSRAWDNEDVRVERLQSFRGSPRRSRPRLYGRDSSNVPELAGGNRPAGQRSWIFVPAKPREKLR